MMTVYIDLNVFDRLEKIDTITGSERNLYQLLYKLIDNKEIQTAYSNAHLNDLFRGYQKNKNYTDGHLKNIQNLTRNLCICQYWGEKDVKWHYRDIFDFFSEKVNEWEFNYASYEDLFSDEPLMKQAQELYKLVPLPAEFKKAYIEPMFGVMFPLSKIHNNQYALQSDLFNFNKMLSSDYGLYKSFKSYLITGLNKIRNNKELVKSLNVNKKEVQKHLELIDIFDAYTPNTKTSENVMYAKVLDVFFKYDLSGYKSDGHYNNMFDDSLHAFYASHFNFFITNDDRCKYKSEKTYERLGIKTRVINISEVALLQTT